MRAWLRSLGRLQLCAGLALLFHGSLLLGGVLGLGSQPEYGMQGAMAGGGGQPHPVLAPPEDSVDLIQDADDAPSEHRARPKAMATPQPQPSAAAPGPASSGAQELPSYFRNPPPRYPDTARRARQEGLVLLRVGVDASGRVASLALLQSSGFPLLDEAAEQGVRDWRFKPAQLAGIGIASSVNVPVQFRLRDSAR